MDNVTDLTARLPERVPPAHSEEALALAFAAEHADRLRYVAAWNKWLIWSGTHWRPDDTRSVFNDSRKVCRSAACNKARQRNVIASAKTVAATLTLACADRRLAATADQWDADPWLLATPAGTIDLRTGDQRAHQPGDFITKMTSVAPGGTCPTFLRFLAEVTDGDIQLQDFLKRLCGYALTGSTKEHALFFLHGLGANGKSVFVSTVTGILGDYHTVAPIETFVASHNDHHPTELAGLRGARLVTRSGNRGRPALGGEPDQGLDRR